MRRLPKVRRTAVECCVKPIVWPGEVRPGWEELATARKVAMDSGQ